MGVEDGRGGVEPVGKQERGALVLHGPSAIRQQGAGVIVHGDIHDDNRALAAFDAFEVLQYLRNMSPENFRQAMLRPPPRAKFSK